MIKKLLENKTVLLAMLSCLFAVLLVIATTFAWFAISSDTETGQFVLPVGMHGSEFEFGEVLDTNIVDRTENTFEDLTVQPGNHYIFVLTVKNAGENINKVSAYFTGVSSFIIDSEDNESTDYTGRENEKIQYIYYYKVTRMFWNTTGTSLFSGEEETINYPTDEEIEELGWIEIDASSYDNVTSEETYFNRQVNGVDISEYYLFNNFELTAKDTPHSTVVVFFELIATNIAKVPNGEEIEASIDIHGDQLFDIANIIITSSRE